MIRNSSTASGLRSIEKISKRALATILVPQCSCCQQVHHLPSRLCAVCLASLKSSLYRQSVRLPSDQASDYSKTEDSITIKGAHSVSGVCQLHLIFFYRDVVPDLLIRWRYDGMVELTNVIASWVPDHSQISASYDLATIVPCHW